MGRKSKHTVNEKIDAVKTYLNGESAVNIALKCDVNVSTIRRWTRKYQIMGNSAFEETSMNKSYTKEFKLEVIHAYLDGEGSYNDLCLKYEISSISMLNNWLEKYNNHIEIQGYDPKGAAYMIKTRKTTLKEREEIVVYCLKSNLNYSKTAEAFNVSYAQVYNWTKKYLELGLEGLKDNRGRRLLEVDLSEVELLERKVKILENQLELKERENTLLKKVKEMERRRYFKK